MNTIQWSPDTKISRDMIGTLDGNRVARIRFYKPDDMPEFGKYRLWMSGPTYFIIHTSDTLEDAQDAAEGKVSKLRQVGALA